MGEWIPVVLTFKSYIEVLIFFLQHQQGDVIIFNAAISACEKDLGENNKVKTLKLQAYTLNPERVL